MSTKPEGPAQQVGYRCPACGCQLVDPINATPTPSQPAAREFGLDAAVGEIIRQVYGPYASTMSADERKTARDTLSEIVSRYARQQTAELRAQRSLESRAYAESIDRHNARAEAAERERDSLREELERTRVDLRAQFDELAALKAGKDGQK